MHVLQVSSFEMRTCCTSSNHTDPQPRKSLDLFYLLSFFFAKKNTFSFLQPQWLCLFVQCMSCSASCCSVQKALKVLQPAVLEEFLRAVEGFGAYCSGPKLKEVLLLSESVRNQWEVGHTFIYLLIASQKEYGITLYSKTQHCFTS